MNNREKNWNVDQKTLQKERILRKINEQILKSWGRPCTTANELEVVLLDKNEDTSNKIARTELSYYRKTHQAARYETP